MNLKSPPRNHGKKKRATIHIEIARVNESLDSIFPLPSNHSKKKSVTIHTKIAPVNEPLKPPSYHGEKKCQYT